MSTEELRMFLIFATGMPFFNCTTTVIQITPAYVDINQMSKWPIWPLPKSFTCFNKILYPFSAVTDYITPNVLDNIRRAIAYNGSEFSDENITSVL
jgi:hypothetical protein